ncbi:hypothetical protein BT69DRAFT_445495 [Atractiella rhizophila]|nr:hypothetical protein BT69DRAFT_445495 [Atractiella rhizophila]
MAHHCVALRASEILHSTAASKGTCAWTPCGRNNLIFTNSFVGLAKDIESFNSLAEDSILVKIHKTQIREFVFPTDKALIQCLIFS